MTTPATTLQFTQVSLEDLIDMLKARIVEEIRHAITLEVENPAHVFLNTQEACEFLQMSQPCLALLRKQGKIKTAKVSEKLVLFRKSDLIEYLGSTISD